MRIGFVGLGQMGRPMAEKLLKAGYELVVHNRSRGAVDALTAQGAVEAKSPAEAAESADVFMSCLLHPEQVRDVYFGPAGALEPEAEGRRFVDFATVVPDLSREIGSAVAARGGSFLDAPVSGGPKGATAGTLSIMIGGSEADFTVLRPVFEVLGSKIFHLGPIGAGTTTKVCNQLLTGVTHALVAEAMVLGTRAGMDPRTLFDVLRQSSGQSNSLERAVPNFILPGRFEAAFAIEGIIKDLECAIRMAKSNGVRTLLGPVAQQLFLEASVSGFAGQDAAAVIRPMERIAGVEVRDRQTT
ncbi:MAG: NAD-binding protein [Alphaproteobacteria bacterium]|nr:NAD-binding protein [Alphaproteobacteria bacterium]